MSPAVAHDKDISTKHKALGTNAQGDDGSQTSIDLQKEVWDSTAVDHVLAKKMALVNNAIDEIGMTPFQWKLFFLNGFGYAVDSVSRRPRHTRISC